jgi:hypothetical protein
VPNPVNPEVRKPGFASLFTQTPDHFFGSLFRLIRLEDVLGTILPRQARDKDRHRRKHSKKPTVFFNSRSGAILRYGR